jgi:ornithine cyclodeaminase/alanine dehydrogenase-like protein (mu-crystallin family)
MQPGAVAKFSIRHAIQGRLRVKVEVWKVSEDQAQALSGWLANQGAVREVQVHPLSRKVR